jgi:hypothetical protein
MRSWWEGQIAPEHAPNGAGGRAFPCSGTEAQRAFLADLYTRLNGAFFDGSLPDVRVRLSDRMVRRFGHVFYGATRSGERYVEEIALNIDLMVSGNGAHLLDTLLHEMAHVEAWLVHGHRDHGRDWRQIARRVGCEARACSYVRIRRRRRRGPPVTRVPAIERALAHRVARLGAMTRPLG